MGTSIIDPSGIRVNLKKLDLQMLCAEAKNAAAFYSMAVRDKQVLEKRDIEKIHPSALTRHKFALACLHVIESKKRDEMVLDSMAAVLREIIGRKDNHQALVDVVQCYRTALGLDSHIGRGSKPVDEAVVVREAAIGLNELINRAVEQESVPISYRQIGFFVDLDKA